jgi:Nuclear pore complex scaffold, nucleoporins 186/192/205
LITARAIHLDTNNEADRQRLLDVLEARLSLLLQISRTRDGAGYILDAGLLQAIRESMLFRADPDIGMGNPSQTHNSPGIPTDQRIQMSTIPKLCITIMSFSPPSYGY